MWRIENSTEECGIGGIYAGGITVCRSTTLMVSSSVVFAAINDSEVARQILIGRIFGAGRAGVRRAGARASATTRRFSAPLQREHGLTLNEFRCCCGWLRAPDRRLKRIELVGRCC
jgi:hypothetical protein